MHIGNLSSWSRASLIHSVATGAMVLFPIGPLESVAIHVVFLYEERKGLNSYPSCPILCSLLHQEGIYPVKRPGMCMEPSSRPAL